MPTSQVKGHRIADRAIELKHLKEDFKLPETKMTLDYPTHDNAGDLTVSQKNTLTQMGNADTLHFHTGGGGGVQGIYTNEERDVQLLRLSMLLNATKYGMDKSVNDTFDDDSSIYYGVVPAKSPTLQALSDDPVVGGTLATSKQYSYGITFNTKYGETSMINADTVTTGTGFSNAVRCIITNVPSNNISFNVYRCDGIAERQLIQNENLSEWENPYNLDMGTETSEKTSGLSCIRVNPKGFSNAAGTAIQYVSNNIALGIGKRVLSFGQPMNSTLTKEVPFEYYIQILNRGDTARVDLIWDKNPANIPLDYELYYTTDYVASDASNVLWQKFERLEKVKNSNNIPLSVSTNGTITDNYKVEGNTRFTNIFTYKAVLDITCIKIVVTRLMQSSNLIDVRLFTEDNNSNTLITKRFSTPQKLSDYSTLKVDMKSNGNHNNVKLGFLKNSDVVGSLVSEWSYNTNAAPWNLTGYTVKCRVRNNTSANRSGYDRIRIQLRPTANQYIRIENVHILVDQTGHTHSDSVIDCAIPDVIVPITWDNGLSYYENDKPDGNVITSDWCYIKFPNFNTYAYHINFTVVSGSLQYNTSATYSEMFLSTNAQGLELSPTWTTMCDIYGTRYWDYSVVELVQLGISNAQYLNMNIFGQTALERWHRHYIPLATGAGSEDVKALAMYFDNLLTDQQVLFDNISLTHSKDILKQQTGSSVIGSNGFLNIANILAVDTTYCQSDLPPTTSVPKNIMFTFTMSYINKLILYYGQSKNCAGCNYAIQFSSDATADVDDPYDSPKWFAVDGLSIGEPGIPQEFTGNIVGNIVYDNNVWDNYITHTFTPIYATKLRVVVFQCISSVVLRVIGAKIMSADDLGDFKKIYTSITPAVENQEFIDDGKPYTEISIPELNTSGSFNVFYDGHLKLIKLVDTNKTGIIYTNELPLSLFISIILTAQVTGTVQFSASIDSGLNFEAITLDKIHTFTSQADSIIFKIELLSSDAALSALAFLYSL